jgi:sulfatase modifying factor 1
MEFSIKGFCGLAGLMAVTLWSCGSKQTAEEKRKADSLAACIADGMPTRAAAIWINGGKFLMGADEFPDSRPMHEIREWILH